MSLASFPMQSILESHLRHIIAKIVLFATIGKMMNVELTTILKALYEKPGATVQDALDANAPTPSEREKIRM